tara:strand:- start:3183 stop:4160 length:978 start_codon:yes stop_codon:yes gene_type:complete
MDEVFFKDGDSSFSVGDAITWTADKILNDILGESAPGSSFAEYFQFAVIEYSAEVDSAIENVSLDEFPISTEKLIETAHEITNIDPAFQDEDYHKIGWIKSKSTHCEEPVYKLDGQEIEWSQAQEYIKKYYELGLHWKTPAEPMQTEQGLFEIIPPLSKPSTDVPADAKAHEHASLIIKKWIQNNKCSFPPVLINISDGKFSDPIWDDKDSHSVRIFSACDDIKNSSTSYGNSLIFNMVIDPGYLATVEFSTLEFPTLEEIQHDKGLMALASNSSILHMEHFDYVSHYLDVDKRKKNEKKRYCLLVNSYNLMPFIKQMRRNAALP